MDISANSNVKRYDIEATIIRADGTIEPLGVIASTAWNKKPYLAIGAWFRIKRVNAQHKKKVKEVSS